MTDRDAAVQRIVDGNGYYDRADTLWALLMICDRCGERTIDCRCPNPDGWHAGERLSSVGRDLKVRDEAAAPSVTGDGLRAAAQFVITAYSMGARKRYAALDTAIPALRAALAESVPEPGLDEARLAAGVKAAVVIRLIQGETNQAYTPTEVSTMVSDVVDEQMARLGRDLLHEAMEGARAARLRSESPDSEPRNE